MRLNWSLIHFIQFIIKRLTFKLYCLIFAGGQIFVGNGYCDDGLNTAECNFDAGDCCGPNANTDYCISCQCLSGYDEITSSSQSSTETTSSGIFFYNECKYGHWLNFILRYIFKKWN